MTIYERSPATDLKVINEWDDGFSWLAHPHESGERVSHAIKTDDGVWVIDPIDAPGIDELLGNFGSVTGVAVLCSYHTRDAGTIATRHDVNVYIPQWMERVAERVDAPIEHNTFGAEFEIYRFEPLSMWQEAIAYREEDGTLIIPDLLGSSSGYTVGNERIGVLLSHRLFPPRDTLGELEVERILVGHGEGVLEDANEALDEALAGARKRFPRALISQFGTNIRLLIAAMRD